MGMNTIDAAETVIKGDEQIEGLDDPTGSGWGDDYPLDSVFVRQESRTVSEVCNRIEKQRYIMDPDFQRSFVWGDEKQSKLIESCVMRIPLPVFYVAEAPDGRIVVVDGLQRLTTFTRFLSGKFKLRGLSLKEDNAPPHPLEGMAFKQLPINLQERVLDTQLILYILDAKAPERARLDIFERVNSGVPLTRQQMRNALYSGPATRWLKDAAASVPFKQATGDSLASGTMRDREAINRFCAFNMLGWENYRGDMDLFLATALKRINRMQKSELQSVRRAFDRSMAANYFLFGRHAFRKSLAANAPNASRSILNISLFDVCSVLIARISGDIQKDKSLAKRVKNAVISLINEEEFSFAITYSTNSTSAVQARFGLAEEALEVQ
jgi:Protein of unknown function DUF262